MEISYILRVVDLPKNILIFKIVFRAVLAENGYNTHIFQIKNAEEIQNGKSINLNSRNDSVTGNSKYELKPEDKLSRKYLYAEENFFPKSHGSLRCDLLKCYHTLV